MFHEYFNPWPMEMMELIYAHQPQVMVRMQLSRLLLRNLAESATSGEEVQPQSFLADYVKFMTTPGLVHCQQ